MGLRSYDYEEELRGGIEALCGQHWIREDIAAARDSWRSYIDNRIGMGPHPEQDATSSGYTYEHYTRGLDYAGWAKLRRMGVL